MLEILPEGVAAALSALEYNAVYEVRLRADCPVTVNYGGRFRYLGEAGVTERAEEAVVADRAMLESVMYRAANYSVYAVNNQLKQGFLALPGGARLGVAGEAVTENGEVTTLKNVTSVALRVPHRVQGCSDRAFRLMKRRDGTGVYSTLFLSPPGAGKTTFLRDVAESIARDYPYFNTLIIDERGELTAPGGGRLALFAGANVDVLFGAPKRYAFTAGLRALRPDVIITDELGGGEDMDAVHAALTAGVAVIASIHAGSLEDLANKRGFEDLLTRRLFDRYVVLSARSGAGTVEGVYDGRHQSLYYSI